MDCRQDLRVSQFLQSFVFTSFKKGHTSAIGQASFSSWLNQSILLCYRQPDQQALDIVQLKHMLLGPLRPLRPFTEGKFEYFKVLNVDFIGYKLIMWDGGEPHLAFPLYYS